MSVPQFMYSKVAEKNGSNSPFIHRWEVALVLKVSLFYVDNKDRFISIACGRITLDFRDYVRMLVDKSNNSLQRSSDNLMHYKFLTTVRNLCLDIAR